MNGWNGALLRINLTERRVTREVVPERWLREYLGGRGLGVRYITREVAPGTDPLSPQNKLAFMVGPLSATAVPTSGRYTVVSLSPATGTIFDSNSGGFFGMELKRCGLDGFILEGRADRPTYLYFRNGDVEFRDAGHLLGLETGATRDKLLEETDPKARVASIGPAGENLGLMASIMNDADRAAGRGGLGAVLGSKNVKAIAVRGDIAVPVADRARLDLLVKRAKKTLDKNTVTGKGLQVFGTSILVNVINAHGMYPTYNFRDGNFMDAEGCSGEKLAELYLTDTSACFNCPIKCGRVTRTSKQSGEGPEYESLWAFTAQCGVNDLEAAIHANYRCNALGLDTISVGNTIGCAMELCELGLLDLGLKWGDAAGMLRMVEDIAHKRGAGARLAEGSWRLANSCGRPDLAMVVKKLEIPAYDPRGTQGHALSYATSNRGGCHMRAYLIQTEILGLPCFMDRFSSKGKAEVLTMVQDLSAAVDSMDLCRFTQIALGVDYYADFLTAVTGVEYDEDDLLAVGRRVYNLERHYNARLGFRRRDDLLPPRFLEEPLVTGGSRGRVVELDSMLDEYYSLRGWDPDGVPRAETLAGLGIEA
jgi:aldehyde:ferredoxin oxidoreductase